MPREGTKTFSLCFFKVLDFIEIKYAPGGDENFQRFCGVAFFLSLRLNMPREGTKTMDVITYQKSYKEIEIKYAPGGDENLNRKQSRTT